jgi:hypothetical protein
MIIKYIFNCNKKRLNIYSQPFLISSNISLIIYLDTDNNLISTVPEYAIPI